MTDSFNQAEFEALLDYVKRSRGFDFTGYKRPSLIRRVARRMQVVNVKGHTNYIDYLEVHPEEFNYLFNTLLINVTTFYRDLPAWEHIQNEVIPRIVATKASGEPIRIWSAGCASGEEAYTIAMVVCQVIGVEQFRDRIKIYATDIDEEALNQARQAVYLEKDLDGLTAEQIQQYFEQSENRYIFRKDLRRSVIFGRHNLIQDAPISRIDLLICRNTLMYFNAETQSRVLTRFHFALREEGFLFLGKAEMLLTHPNIFAPLHLKCRIFTKVSKLNLRDQLLLMARTGNEQTVNCVSNQMRLREVAFDKGPWACIVVDIDGTLALMNEQARLLFNLATSDLNRPLQDLELSYRPAELRSCIEQAYNDRKTVSLRDIEWQPSRGEPVYLDIEITPLMNLVSNILGAGITFIDISRAKHLQEELEHSNKELETAYEELQSTNEELETTNEELHSTNEELETTNEELQSTNEELETMNEELQATNEELSAVNGELNQLSEELNQSNAFLESILTSLKEGVVVVDRNLSVQIWNQGAGDLWGLEPEEAIGQNFLNLDIGLPVDQLRQSIQASLSGLSDSFVETTLLAISRGRNFQCHVICTPLVSSRGQIRGVTLLMKHQPEAES